MCIYAFFMYRESQSSCAKDISAMLITYFYGWQINIFCVSSYFWIMNITKVALVTSKIKKIMKQDNDLT